MLPTSSLGSELGLHCLKASCRPMVRTVEFRGEETKPSPKLTLPYNPITRPRAENHRWFCMDFLKERYSKCCYLGSHNKMYTGTYSRSIWKEKDKNLLMCTGRLSKSRVLLQFIA